MLGFSIIQMVRRNGKKLDQTLRKELIQFYQPFRSVPCFLHRPLESIRKRTKNYPVIIEFEQTSFEAGIQEVQSAKCKNLKTFPLVTCCSAKLSLANLEKLLESCSSIKKVYYDREVTALLDTATSSVQSTLLHQSGYTGVGKTIAIVDTGIHPHEDLSGRITGFVDFVNGQIDPYDDNGHGTHCAGDAAGNGLSSNDRNYIGPAPEADLVGVKVLDKMGSGTLSTVIEGIQWCVQNRHQYNIDILSLSLGAEAIESAKEDPVVQAVDRAWESGIVVCVAAGNSGPKYETIASPGISPLVITVGAADDNESTNRTDDIVAEFSSRGPAIDGNIKPDLITPGVNITSLRAPGSFLDKTNKAARVSTNYISLSGTSMATPICAGIVAQLLQKEPHLNPNQVKQRLLQACTDIGQPPNVQGSGYLNAANLL
ncbi:S8 family peptidase [Ornithinibacillus californiensis]|uniref:S8 family peptidase n=1 Tax=Ornithinibacillus californiensis TaxID=161536 RepID=UPI00064DC851|nr:S8 family peptidase [Ornithinibacillus californiensis]